MEDISPTERRLKILEKLSLSRYDTCDNLANELHVSTKTIRRDIGILMCQYPIETVSGRFGGGVRVMNGYYFHYKLSGGKFLDQKEVALLRELREQLTGDKRDTLDGIFVKFAP